MILNLALIAFQQDNGFGGDFADDTDPYSLTMGLPFDPHWLIAAVAGVILVLVAGMIARAVGKGVAHRRLFQGRLQIAEGIYEEIDRALNRALRAPGASQMDRVRELRDLLQARFGHVIALTNRPEKTRKALAEALEADGGTIKTHESTGAKVKVAKASEEHRILVWTQLQAFREFWDRKSEIIRMISEAQNELVVANPRWYLAKLEQSAPKVMIVKETVVAPVVAATQAPEMVKEIVKETVKVSEDDKTPPPPPPPPPAPPPTRGKKLPAHKRNMLA